MNARDYIQKYLIDAKLMQVATVGEGKPWICTVHYVEDNDLNLYWLSLPTRRHSQDIANNNHVAVAVAVKHEKPVVGIQAEGNAEIVDDPETIKVIMKKYVAKFDIGGQFYDNFVAGKNQHQLYKFTAQNFVLFDEINFSGEQARHEWKPSV